MKAYTLTSYGQDGTTTWADVPAPQAGPGQVLIKVRAAGLNPLDAMIARGDFKQLLSYRLPLTLGQEVAGDVLAVGEGVSNFAVGIGSLVAYPSKLLVLSPKRLLWTLTRLPPCRKA